MTACPTGGGGDRVRLTPSFPEPHRECYLNLDNNNSMTS
jgi:hypothetical protein